jgi:hypothetical protein
LLTLKIILQLPVEVFGQCFATPIFNRNVQPLTPLFIVSLFLASPPFLSS